MKTSLKNLVEARPQPAQADEAATSAPQSRPVRQAMTRVGTRQIAGNFKSEVATAFRMLAAEQDKENQELLAEALNMLFERYGKAMRAEVTAGRRRR